MEKYFASFPRYGKLSSTVWKTRGNAPARTILYADLRARNPAPRFMKMRAEQWGPGYGLQAAVMRWLPLATIAILTPGGSILTRDVSERRRNTDVPAIVAGVF